MSFKRSAFLYLLLGIVLLESCQQEIDPYPLPPVTPPASSVDSTLLIKSITVISFDDVTGLAEDSATESYMYDTLNRKIILSLKGDGADLPDGSTCELSYNQKNLVTTMLANYAPGYTPNDFDPKRVDIVYDANDILQKITTTYGTGRVESTVYTKTVLTGGTYQLSWKEDAIAAIPGGFLHTATFDATGLNKKNTLTYEYVAVDNGSSNNILSQFIRTDSIAYDATGSISKIFTTEVDTFLHSNDSFVSFEALSRQTRGNQLGLQRQAILRGIANIPLANEFQIEGAGGILSSFGDVAMQFTRYPIIAVKVRDFGSPAYFSFNAQSDYDSAGRLTRFRGYVQDSELFPKEFEIVYYK